LNAAFIADVTIPDGTTIAAGKAFIKTWRVQNSGTCDWGAGFQLVFASGEQMGGPPAASVPATAAGAAADISVNLVAPTTPGEHAGQWRIRAKDGTVFGPSLSVVITVPGPTTVPTVVVTSVPPTVAPTVMVSKPPVFIVTKPFIFLLPKTEQVLKQVSVAGNSIGHAVADCPSGSIVTGGGYGGNDNLFVYNSSKTGNGWQVYARNKTGSSQLLNAYAICLSNTKGSSSQVNQVSTSGSGIGHAVANCPAGSVVTGGGFAGNDNLFVYNSSMSGNGWQVYAKNTSGSSQLLNAYAICLAGTNGTTNQVFAQSSVASKGVGHTVASCPSGALITGGGFAGSANLIVYTSKSSSDDRWEVYAKNTAASSDLLNSCAICAKFP